MSRPHFSLAWPLNCFQFPSIQFQSMMHSFLLVSFCFDLIPAAAVTSSVGFLRSPPASTGAAEEKQENPWSRGHPPGAKSSHRGRT